jgi:threonyl-tRNA synthetase
LVDNPVSDADRFDGILLSAHNGSGHLWTADVCYSMTAIMKDKDRVMAAIQEQLRSVEATIKVIPGGRECDIHGLRVSLDNVAQTLHCKLHVPRSAKVQILVEGTGFGQNDHLVVIENLKANGYENLLVSKRGFLTENDRARDDA